MRSQRNLVRDQQAAATEIGYVLTFMLGLTLLSMFSVWTWGIQDDRGEAWREQAVEHNLDAVAAAVERADIASRLDGNTTYAEPVHLLLGDAVNLKMRMLLTDDGLTVQDRAGTIDASRTISSTSSSTHSGEIELAGIEVIWVVYSNGETTIDSAQPGV